MPDASSLLAGPVCLGFGVLFTLQAVRRLRTERRQGQQPLRREPLSGRELLWEGLADAGTVTVIATLSAVVVLTGIGAVYIRHLRRSASSESAAAGSEAEGNDQDTGSRPIVR